MLEIVIDCVVKIQSIYQIELEIFNWTIWLTVNERIKTLFYDWSHHKTDVLETAPVTQRIEFSFAAPY